MYLAPITYRYIFLLILEELKLGYLLVDVEDHILRSGHTPSGFYSNIFYSLETKKCKKTHTKFVELMYKFGTELYNEHASTPLNDEIKIGQMSYIENISINKDRMQSLLDKLIKELPPNKRTIKLIEKLNRLFTRNDRLSK